MSRSDRRSSLAPVSLTLWGCGIIIVWWVIVLGSLGAAGWLVTTGVRLAMGS